ncbi:MAG: hypothetical protein AAFY91_10895 [Bacteroidota bacterium]
MSDTSLSDHEYISNLLKNEEVIQVCIGLGEVILNFTNELVVSIYFAVELTSSTGETSTIAANVPNESKELVTLLGQSIKSYSVDSEEVSLLFTNNSIKLLKGKHYESFSISKGKSAIYI